MKVLSPQHEINVVETEERTCITLTLHAVYDTDMN